MTDRARAVLAAVSLASGLFAAGQGAHAQQAVTLTQWQTNLRPADLDGINKLITAFEAKNPGIKIKIEQTPWATHNQKLLAANSAGSGLPDVGRTRRCRPGSKCRLCEKVGRSGGPCLEGLHCRRRLGGCQLPARRREGQPYLGDPQDAGDRGLVLQQDHVSQGGTRPRQAAADPRGISKKPRSS